MPVIMMSGHATIDTAVEATRIGALNFLEKPISLQKLLKAVQQGLSRSVETVRPVNIQVRTASPQIEPTRTVQEVPYAANNPVHSPASVTSMNMMQQETQLFSLSFDLPLREARDAFERAYFEHHLTREGGSMTRVAEKTGLERTHLYRKLKQLGVEPGKLSKKGG
jgi:DNA-binding NtrC family response regulator